MGAAAFFVVPHTKRLEKFTGQNVKWWQQKMFFYLTTLNLVRPEEDAPIFREGEVDPQVLNAIDAWNHYDFLYKNYVLNGLSDSRKERAKNCGSP